MFGEEERCINLQNELITPMQTPWFDDSISSVQLAKNRHRAFEQRYRKTVISSEQRTSHLHQLHHLHNMKSPTSHWETELLKTPRDPSSALATIY